MQAYGSSDIGMLRRGNEDSFYCQLPLLIVADGMGGHMAGEVASQMAVDNAVMHLSSDCKTGQEIETQLCQAVESANHQIYEAASTVPEQHGMGTTLTIAYVKEEMIYWAHVGDSRLYIIRDNDIKQITQDHSLVGEMVRQGTLSIAEAEKHPQKNILTKAVGTNPVISMDLGKIAWQYGDIILLCSDGLTSMMDDETILQIVSDHKENLSQSVQRLLDNANQNGGLDNITVIIAKHDSIVGAVHG